MPKLPSSLSARLRQNSELVAAYAVVLQAERNLEETGKGDSSISNERLIYCRILGCLLEYAPGDRSRGLVASEISGCGREQGKLLELGKWYYDHFERILQAGAALQNLRNRDPYADCPADANLPPPATQEESTKGPLLGSHKLAHRMAKRRDDRHCQLTGGPDIHSLVKYKWIEEKWLREEQDRNPVPAQGYHILHQITAPEDGDDYSKTAWALIERLGFRSILDELRGTGVHRLENMMTMSPFANRFFNSLNIWLSPVDNEPNAYYIKHDIEHYEVLDLKLQKKVVFSTKKPGEWHLPSPKYLEIHAACARVAHFSGAGDYINDRILAME
ncbi:hypothetical protein DFP72DRAFT_388919 [Ephemerocybe angulata]|uniref:HNH nuclease domain-containing protein n=1 Tax=Ephemerocybe angulata TaxID=980116 RepID=A0A8H6HVQ8_9AGAR|nr:hypothetical protein DFP72DRAFT_388919 [Tulosesus angulatus]